MSAKAQLVESGSGLNPGGAVGRYSGGTEEVHGSSLRDGTLEN